ncbi:uncharacterized protein VNE69_11010 [Vairimorpha necatrix]|uniref:Uncharacterized protein n=1 Tax=Vairimorpha necatrix TaxID=6039 RepID=A0AAX4JG37_9MICR
MLSVLNLYFIYTTNPSEEDLTQYGACKRDEYQYRTRKLYNSESSDAHDVTIDMPTEETINTQFNEAESISTETIHQETIEGVPISTETISQETIEGVPISTETISQETICTETIIKEIISTQFIEGVPISQEIIEAESINTKFIEAVPISQEDISTQFIEAESSNAEVILTETRELKNEEDLRNDEVIPVETSEIRSDDENIPACVYRMEDSTYLDAEDENIKDRETKMHFRDGEDTVLYDIMNKLEEISKKIDCYGNLYQGLVDQDILKNITEENNKQAASLVSSIGLLYNHYLGVIKNEILPEMAKEIVSEIKQEMKKILNIDPQENASSSSSKNNKDMIIQLYLSGRIDRDKLIPLLLL